MSERYRVVPWRGMVSGRTYYRIERASFLFWREVITCFSEQEADEMLLKLRRWDGCKREPQVTTLVGTGKQP